VDQPVKLALLVPPERMAQLELPALLDQLDKPEAPERMAQLEQPE
jgi:hypothetical protein